MFSICSVFRLLLWTRTKKSSTTQAVQPYILSSWSKHPYATENWDNYFCWHSSVLCWATLVLSPEQCSVTTPELKHNEARCSCLIARPRVEINFWWKDHVQVQDLSYKLSNPVSYNPTSSLWPVLWSANNCVWYIHSFTHKGQQIFLHYLLRHLRFRRYAE